jgi:hypothetical protein
MERESVGTSLSRASLAVIGLVTLVVLFTDLRRLQDPVGEKYLSYLPPGAADFVPFYFGACALVSGVNPYHNDVEAWRDPWRREAIVAGRPTAQVYLPTHLVIYTPLVLAAGGDPLRGGNPRGAARLWFDLNLLFLGVLTLVTAAIIGRAKGQRVSAQSLPLLVFLLLALSLNAGTVLGLERGQSEILTALCCWSAVWLVLRRRPAEGMFLAVTAALLKGYAALFAAGLGLLLFERRSAGRALLGAVVAILLLLLPVASYVPDALALAKMRALGLDAAFPFVASWQNHSFRNLALQLAPGSAGLVENALRLLALLASALSWRRARRALREDADASGAALWLSLFACCALGTMISLPSVSYSYNTIQVLPGALVLALGQERLTAALRPRAALALRVVLLVACGLLFAYALDIRSPLPADALGLTLLFGLAAVASIRPEAPSRAASCIASAARKAPASSTKAST